MTRNSIHRKILKQLKYPVHGLLKLAPRVGKTRLAIEILKKQSSQKILWVTPNTKLRDYDLPMEFVKWDGEDYLDNTTFICYASLKNHKGVYDTIILDEFQYITEKNMFGLLRGRIQYSNIIGLSGTDPSVNIKQKLLKELKLSSLYEISIEEAVDSKVIAPYEIFLVPGKLDGVTKNIPAGSSAKPFFQTEQGQYNYLSSIIEKHKERVGIVPERFYFNRMRFIYNLPSKQARAKHLIANLEGRTLIFTGSIDQAKKLSPHTYHSKTDNKDLNLFLEHKIDKLSCVNSGGIGFTYTNVDNFVIVQVNSNKMGDITQKIARSLLLQKDYTAKIYILYTVDTVDEVWLEGALKDFNKENITILK